MTNYDDLVQFANVRQLEFIEAIRLHGSQRKAAKALGLTKSTVDESLAKLRAKAAKSLPSLHNYAESAVPAGYAIKGVSQYVNSHGKVAGQWIKTSTDAQAQEAALKAAVEAMCEDIKPALPIQMPSDVYKNLCNVYTLTDSHVGMLAWHKEGGADWDLTIAETILVGCFRQMVNSSPMAETCVIAQLGDFLHYDSSLAPVTPQHGHVLDADGRMPKMVKVAVRILRTVIDLALAKHQKVVLLLAEGNHDMTSSVWLRAMFQALYENEPRIQVIDSELPY